MNIYINSKYIDIVRGLVVKKAAIIKLNCIAASIPKRALKFKM